MLSAKKRYLSYRVNLGYTPFSFLKEEETAARGDGTHPAAEENSEPSCKVLIAAESLKQLVIYPHLRKQRPVYLVRTAAAFIE